MRDTAPAGATGYVAVSINGGEHWQGFHVTDDHRRAGEGILATVRDANASGGPQPGVEVARGLLSVAEADQPAVGALAAVLATLMERGTAMPQPEVGQAQAILDTVGAAAWALKEVTGERWLHVSSTRDPRGGWRTQVRRFDAADLDEAREAIVADIRKGKVTSRIADEFIGSLARATGRRDT